MNKKIESLKTLIKAFLLGCLVILFPIISGVICEIFKLDTIETLFVQGIFMILSLIIPLICVLKGKWKIKEIGFNRFNIKGIKKSWYFIPVMVLFIPVLLSGFYFKSTPYVFGCLFLYLFVGISEEIYFRGIVPNYLGKSFNQKQIIIFSTLIFGIGHLATAFTGSSLIDTALVVFNAFIFGWMAIEIFILSGNICLPILFHFIFDFETKIIAMSGTGLMLAELVRGTIMFLVALWLAFVIKNKDRIPKVLDEVQKAKRNKKIKIELVFVK